jgi:hypothetical protein
MSAAIGSEWELRRKAFLERIRGMRLGRRR